LQTNHEKAVEVSNHERRFFMKECCGMHYPNEHLSELGALAKDDRVRQLFFQHLRTIDVSCLQKGQAPLTTYKRQAIADQAPAAIKWLKHVVSESPNNMTWVP